MFYYFNKTSFLVFFTLSIVINRSGKSHRMIRIVLFNKPYDVLSQFTDSEKRNTLADFISIKNVYPAGRLDRDSEGLLILTDSGKLQALISDPVNKLPKTYYVQVEGIPGKDAAGKLRRGVELSDGITKPADVKIINPPKLWERFPPVRFRKSVPDSWLSLKIFEGRNRQVRRMTAAVGFPTLRLVRISIGNFTLGELSPGEFKVLRFKNISEIVESYLK